jgi:hypothetical protein
MSLRLDICLDLYAAILLLAFEPHARAHDIYAPLKDRWGNSCCDDRDCRPAPYRVTPTGVQMLVNGEWISVPEYTIQYRALPEDTGKQPEGIGAGPCATGTAKDGITQPTAQSCLLTLR